MPFSILLTINNITLEAQLNDTPTAKAIYSNLPITTDNIDIYGKSIQIKTPVKMQYDNTNKVEIEIGELGYWPLAKAICLFWDTNPKGLAGKCQPPAPVNPIGDILDKEKLKQLAKINNFVSVEITKNDDKTLSPDDQQEIEDGKKTPLALFYEAEKYYKQNDNEQAIKYYQKALVINPFFHPALVNLGNVFFENNEMDKAIESWSRAIQANHNDHISLNNIGYAYEMKQEYEKAIEYYQKSLDINPNYQMAKNNLAAVKEILDNNEE